MQVIRLSRTGRRNQPAFRIVLAEKSAAVNGKFQEVLGTYNVSEGKKLEFNAARIEHWIKMGAKPSDTVASILKKAGVPNMDQYIGGRNLQRVKKNPEEVAEETREAPVEGGEAAEEETPKEEAPAEQTEAVAEATPEAKAEGAPEETKEVEASEETAPVEEAPAPSEEKPE